MISPNELISDLRISQNDDIRILVTSNPRNPIMIEHRKTGVLETYEKVMEKKFIKDADYELDEYDKNLLEKYKPTILRYIPAKKKKNEQ